MHPFRRIAIAGIVIAIFGSLGFTLYAGRQNSSIVLVAMFACWVVSPLAALLIGNLVFRKFSDGLLLLVGVASFAAYAWAAFWPPKTTAAAPFLMIPLATWIVAGLAAWRGRLSSDQSTKF